MASGFSEIGQTLLKRKLIPWVITTGLAAQRPWEKASVKNL
jgi:deoxyhypusine synthase